jgi:hypothetical protein
LPTQRKKQQKQEKKKENKEKKGTNISFFSSLKTTKRNVCWFLFSAAIISSAKSTIF